MGVEPFLLSSSLLGVMAQRLVRLLCLHCREQYQPSVSEFDTLGLDRGNDVTLYRALGCPECNESGYRGRTGIYELIEVDNDLRELIHGGASEQVMLSEARKHYPGIDADGRRRVLAGETSIEEVLRVTSIQ